MPTKKMGGWYAADTLMKWYLENEARVEMSLVTDQDAVDERCADVGSKDGMKHGELSN